MTKDTTPKPPVPKLKPHAPRPISKAERAAAKRVDKNVFKPMIIKR